MNYIKVEWIHSFPNEPTVMYSELDAQRWELRKVEVYPDGRYGYASSDVSEGGSALSKEPIPELTQIASDPQFLPRVITQEEFEHVWLRAREKK